MFAARGRVIRFVDENVIAAGGADHAINRFAELVMSRLHCVFLTRLRAADWHLKLLTPSTLANM